jgi:hypothetical protein
LIELLENFYIDGIGGQFVLKQKYRGKRNGVEQDCFKTFSYHSSFESAAQAFLSLFQKQNNDSALISLSEYVNRVIRANTQAVEAIQESKMERFYIYQPKGTPQPQSHAIVDYIPVGRDNAISRASLLYRCVRDGLISGELKPTGQDRAMRKLIEKARVDYTILNLSNGKGYYRVSRDDLQDLQRYIKQEEKRAKSTFKNISMAKKLYEDYKAGRIDK